MSSGALLFAEGFEWLVDRLLELEAVLVEGIERAVEALLRAEDAFVKGEDGLAGGESRSNASIDVPMLLMYPASDDTSFKAVGSHGIWAGLPVSVPFDTGLVSVGRAGRSPFCTAPVLDDGGVSIAVLEASSPANLPVSAVERLEIAVAQASSSAGSAGSAVSTVGEHGLVTEASDTSSGLLVCAAGDSG